MDIAGIDLFEMQLEKIKSKHSAGNLICFDIFWKTARETWRSASNLNFNF